MCTSNFWASVVEPRFGRRITCCDCDEALWFRCNTARHVVHGVIAQRGKKRANACYFSEFNDKHQFFLAQRHVSKEIGIGEIFNTEQQISRTCIFMADKASEKAENHTYGVKNTQDFEISSKWVIRPP